MNKEDSVLQMNKYGKARKPFFFMIDFLMEDSVIIPLDKIETDKILFETPLFSVNELNAISGNPDVSITVKSVSKEKYHDQFNKVVSEIKMGNSFLVNLTCETPVELSCKLKDIYQKSKAKYKLWYKDKFVVFSPESFVKIIDGQISSYPMKGTIDADLPNAAETILGNTKEAAEHSTIVDLIRNDLSIVSENVKVARFRYIDELVTDRGRILQVSSEITGKLSDNYNTVIGDILFSLLPAGSVTGAPKKKTVQIITETESYKRGYYTGIFGIFDGDNLDSGVMIRFIEKTSGGYVYKSGGGITAYSKIDDEFNEMIQKIYIPHDRKY